MAQRPGFDALPKSQQPHELERLRQRFQDNQTYRELVEARDDAQRALELAYPDLFVSDADINELRKSQREKLKDDPQFRAMIQRRAKAWRAQQDFLFRNDKRLAELQTQLKNSSSDR